MDRPFPRSARVESSSTVFDPSPGLSASPNEDLNRKSSGTHGLAALTAPTHLITKTRSVRLRDKTACVPEAGTPEKGQCARLRSISTGCFHRLMPVVAPFSTRNLTTRSNFSDVAASSAVRPSVLAALTSMPRSTASLTVSSTSVSRSLRSG